MVSIHAAAARGATQHDISSSVKFTSTAPTSNVGVVTVSVNVSTNLIAG